MIMPPDVAVTGLTFAIAWSQSGIVSTGTKIELAKTSGKIATKPADCAASGPFATNPTYAKIQLSAKPNAATTMTHATAEGKPSSNRKPIA